MKKALVLSMVLAAFFAASAMALPYLDVHHFLIADGADVPAARVEIGWVFALAHTYELDCPEVDPCGGIRQFDQVSMCGNIYFGVNDFWVIPRSPFIGLLLDFEWWVFDFELATEIGLDDDWGDFPLETPPFEYWNTSALFEIMVVDWFSFRLGSDFVYDDAGAGVLEMWPFFGFRIGDQYGCPDCP